VLLLRVPVLAALEPFEDGAERPFAGSLVLFQGASFPGEPGDEARQSRPAFGREYAPGQETVRALELRVLASTLEQLLQRRAQSFRCFQRKLYRRTAG
jgi:hypothetical protein